MTPSALVVDDEQALREYLIRLLQRLWPELQIIAEAESGVEALELIAEKSPAIVFLDIRMPGLTGLEVAQKIRGNCHVVFVTAYDQHAVAAFENEAVDYLLKPVTEARLKQTIARLQQRIDETPKDISRLLDLLQKGEPLSQERPRLKWIKASWKDEIQLVSVEDIIYFHSGDKYTSLFTPQREYLLRTPLKELEQQLNPDAWWRIHRATIVKVEAVKACKRDISGRLRVSLHGSDRELPVSRSFQYLFKSD